MFSKLKRILHPENMLFKMIILNCGLLLLVTLVLTAAGNYIYEESIAERSYANTMEIQNQVLKSLDLIFKSVEDNVEALGNYPEVQEYLKVDVENQQASRVELERQVRDLLLDYSRIYSEYLNIVVVSEKGQYLSNDSYRVKKLPLTEEKWYQDAVLANGELVLSPTSLGRNLKAWKNYSTDNYVSTAKLICDRQTSAGIGVILIDLDLKSIQNLVEDITMGQTGFGYIQDSQGHVLYAPQNEVVYRMNPNWVTDGESGRVRCRIKGKDYNVIYSHSKYTDLTAVGVFDWGKTIEGISRARTVSKWIAVDKAASVTYGKVILPENLYVIGTVNMDETTFSFSKKVLDRANTIEFSYVDLVPDFSEALEEAEAQNCKNDFLKTDYITLMSDTATEDRQFVSDICFELQEINEILQCAQAHVGYRVRDEIIFYMLNNKKAELLDTNLAFDNEIMQKILPRIQGSSASIKDMLCELFKKCAGDYTGLSQASVSEQMQVYVETKDCKYKKSAEKICYMMRRFEEDGFTFYWL